LVVGFGGGTERLLMRGSGLIRDGPGVFDGKRGIENYQKLAPVQKATDLLNKRGWGKLATQEE